jgi:nucleoside-triphosphatase THEP1
MAAPRPRHLFLTGFPGAGKTTCVLAALDALVAACGEASILGGFVTREVRDDATGARLGFDVHTLPPSRSRRHPLARRVADHPSETARDDAPNPHVVGAYAVDVRGALERVVVPNLREICSEEPEPEPEGENPTPTPTPTRAAPRGAVSVVVIDEAGKMESLAPAFAPAVRAALANPRVVVLGVVPVGRKVNVARDVKDDPGVRCVTLDEENRDGLARAIGEALVRCVRSNEPEIRLDEGGGGNEDATTRGNRSGL